MGAAIGVVAGMVGGGGAGGMLGGLLGGAGGAGGAGGIFGLISQAISSGPEIIKAVGGLFGQAAGKGVEDGADKLCKDHGMPKFVGEAVKKAVKEALAEHDDKSTGSAKDAKDAAATKFAHAIKEFSEAMSKDLVDETLANKGESNTSGSWYEALAKALGKMLDKQADKVKAMADKSGGAEGGEGAKGGEGGQADKPSDNAELNAASQKMSQLMGMVDNILKTLGEGMSRLSAK